MIIMILKNEPLSTQNNKDKIIFNKLYQKQLKIMKICFSNVKTKMKKK